MAAPSKNEPSPTLEIERVFLLHRQPALPAHAERWQIEQGYLPQAASVDQIEGRLRRVQHADGRVDYIHTIKRGLGRIREEVEKHIDPSTFAREWPRTVRQRLSKTRYRVRENDLVWEVDVFDQPRGLFIAEVEIPHEGFPIEFPAWLTDEVAREVTDDPRFTNRFIARQLGGLED